MTTTPLQDVLRNFSCNVNVWYNNLGDALDFQSQYGALTKPKYDSYSQLWCGDPELGISAFYFNNEKSLKEAFVKAKYYGEPIAIFYSDDYILDVGIDSEDVFKNGTFLCFIQELKEFSYAEISKKYYSYTNRMVAYGCHEN